MKSFLHVGDPICLYPRVLRLVQRCGEGPTRTSKTKEVIVHLGLEFVVFAPTCLGRRDQLPDFPNRTTTSHRNEARRTDKSSQPSQFSQVLYVKQNAQEMKCSKAVCTRMEEVTRTVRGTKK